MAEQTDPAQQKSTLRRIINAAHTAFLVTANDHGLHGRPMVTAQATENLDAFYFPTARDSGKVEELAGNDAVFLGYVAGNEWATISGRGRIVDDRAKIHEVYTALWRDWFDGPDDPKLVLIEVTPQQAEYWDSHARAIVLAKTAFTAVTGIKTDVGGHAKVSMQTSASDAGRPD